MNITSQDRLGFQGDLADIRADSRLCYLCVPSVVKQEMDLDTLSANNLTTGNGLGGEDDQWRIYALRVHFRNVDTSLMTFGHVPPGVVLGDALVNFGLRDLPAFQQGQGNDDSYLAIDSETFHIISVLPSGLGQIEEYCADCRRFTPKFRAEGY